MIKNSFIFLDRVSAATEQKLWSKGILTWDSFLEANGLAGFSRSRKSFFDRQIHSAKKRLQEHDASFFADKFPCAETWRLYDHFKDDAVFLDIETTGYYGDITVIGLYDGNETKAFVKGFSLDKQALKRELSRYDMIVTFNGRCFDVPVINRYFNGVVPDVPHLDLRFACAKLGLHGGLKSIERELGISRADEVSDMSGEDAVYLWRKWEATGDREHLDKVVQYNEEDIVNLKPLAEYAFKNLKKDMMSMFGR